MRLRTMHSHWVCRERGAMVLRPTHFMARNVQHLLTLGQGAVQGPGQVSYDCRRVPPHLQSSMHWTQQLEPGCHDAELPDKVCASNQSTWESDSGLSG